MKIRLELFGASKDFSEKEYIDLDLKENSSIKDLRQKVINYLDNNFNGNENFKKIAKLQHFALRIII